MVGWNYDGGAEGLTEEERGIYRSYGALALGLGGAYLLLTKRGEPLILGQLKISGAGTHQEHGMGSLTVGTIDMAQSEGVQNLGGHNLNSQLTIWCIHNAEEEISVFLEATFDDSSTATKTLPESSREAPEGEEGEEGEGGEFVESLINIDPQFLFDDQININGKSITKYTVTLNVSGKGKRLALQFTIGA